jgi:hypothetical protein
MEIDWRNVKEISGRCEMIQRMIYHGNHVGRHRTQRSNERVIETGIVTPGMISAREIWRLRVSQILMDRRIRIRSLTT